MACLRRGWIISCLIFMAVCAGCVLDRGGNAWFEPSPLPEREKEVLAEINRIRNEAGLKELAFAPDIQRLAREQTTAMIRLKKIGHEDKSGLTVEKRAQRRNIDFQLVAENVGRTRKLETPVAEVSRKWLASPLHKDNIMNPSFTETGLGVAMGNDGYLYMTQIFLRRMP